MSELMFVIKSLVAAFVVIFIMQTKVGGISLENKAEAWLHDAKTAKFLQNVADGAIKAGENGTLTLSTFFNSEQPRHKSSPNEQKASH